VVPEYLLETLASLMPMEKDACFRFHPIGEGMGTVGLPGALVVRGQEEIEYGTGKVMAWKVEQLRLGGGAVSTYWFEKPGHNLKVNYGVAWGIRTTKEAALADLHAELKPQTAD
jgi:hypothetical protein